MNCEKLVTIAENQLKVYNTGHNDGHKVGYEKGQEIGYKEGKAEGKTEGYNEGHTKGYEEGHIKGYEEGLEHTQSAYEQGKQDAYDEFWDNYQDSGERTNYQYAFTRQGWNDVTFKPKYDMKPTTCAQMFQSCQITDLEVALQKCGVTLDTSDSTSFLQMIQSSKITVLPKLDARKSTNMNYAFSVGTIKVIRELAVSETTPFSNTFSSSFEEIKITGTIGQNGFSLNAPNLSHDSIESIINALSTTTSGLSIRLSETAVNKAFETSEGAADGSTSEEWLSLIATRSNWTITLA